MTDAGCTPGGPRGAVTMPSCPPRQGSSGLWGDLPGEILPRWTLRGKNWAVSPQPVAEKGQSLSPAGAL